MKLEDLRAGLAMLRPALLLADEEAEKGEPAHVA